MKYLFLFILLSITYSLKAQEDPVKLRLRHIKGIRGIEAGYGVSKFGTYYSLGYLHFLNNNYFLNPSLGYEVSKIGLSDVREYFLLFSVHRTIYRVEDVLFINVGISPCVQVQTSSNVILDREDISIPVGGTIDINIEFYPFNNLSITGKISEIYSYKDKFGSFRYLAGGGLRFYFN